MEDFNKNENGFNSADTNSGYTVTPQGGYYNVQKDNIIQDAIPQQQNAQEPVRPAQQPYNNYNNNPNNQYGGYYTNQKPKKEKKRFGFGVIILTCILAAVVGAVSSMSVILPRLGLDVYEPATELQTAENEEETVKNNVNINVEKTAENVVEAVAEKVTPSVVGIRTTTSVMSFFGGTSEASGDGSGVVYTKDGYIITNYHVIGNAINNQSGKIEVYLDSKDSEGKEASVVGYNIAADLAVIKIKAKNLTPVEFSDSDKLKVGQYVITIGNPGGLEFMDSVTYGVISGLDRVVSSDSDVELIQTDAAINPGNSGGALVNTQGKLVGINSAKIVSEEFEGMGFAIPSNTVKQICNKIIERENSPEPYIGISISERYTAEVLEYYGYPSGAVVLSVADGSPAQNAGIQKGDIITEYDGKEIGEYTDLEDYIMDSTPGNTVVVKIYRNGRYYTTDIKVASNNAVN